MRRHFDKKVVFSVSALLTASAWYFLTVYDFAEVLLCIADNHCVRLPCEDTEVHCSTFCLYLVRPCRHQHDNEMTWHLCGLMS